jgi:hypothetical protein
MNIAISDMVRHQGGVRATPGSFPVKWDRTVTGSPARPPTYRNDTGGNPTEKPPHEVKLPSVRRIEVSKDFWLPQWAREIVDRKGTVEEMVRPGPRRRVPNPVPTLPRCHIRNSFVTKTRLLGSVGRTLKS